MAKRIAVFAGVVAMLGLIAWSVPAQAQDNDHYACYQSKTLKDANKFDGHKIKPKPSGTLDDQVATGSFEKCKFKLLCVPTNKNGGGAPANPNLHYCGWQCKGFKGSAVFTTTDQFGAGPIEAKKLKFILTQCSKA
jgi:hypothetical protein